MKTKQFFTLGLLAIGCLATAQVNSDATHETKVRIKKVEIINGVEKTTDTIYTVAGPISMNNLDRLDAATLPPLPDLQEHLIISENKTADKSSTTNNIKKVIVFTDKIEGYEFDSLIVDDKLNTEIQKVLKAAGSTGELLKVDQTVCVTTPQNGNISNNRIEKIIIVKTSKITEPTAKDLNSLGIKYTEPNKMLALNTLEVSPNPNTGKFNLKFDLASQGDTQINILAPDGKIVYAESLKNFTGNYNIEISLTKLPAGIYYLKVQQNQKTAVKKLVIE